MEAIAKSINNKLFAVTQDIKVGDEVLFRDESPHHYNKDIVTKIEKAKSEYEQDTIHFKNHEKLWRSGEPFKVLGEISADATWVDHNDDIEIELERVWKYSKWQKDFIAKVKCPTCKHYH